MNHANNNPLFVVYANARGKTPDEMLVSDRDAWPGGSMCGFILWVRGMKRDFYKLHPEAFMNSVDTLVDADAFLKFAQESNEPRNL